MHLKNSPSDRLPNSCRPVQMRRVANYCTKVRYIYMNTAISFFYDIFYVFARNRLMFAVQFVVHEGVQAHTRTPFYLSVAVNILVSTSVPLLPACEISVRSGPRSSVQPLGRCASRRCHPPWYGPDHAHCPSRCLRVDADGITHASRAGLPVRDLLPPGRNGWLLRCAHAAPWTRVRRGAAPGNPDDDIEGLPARYGVVRLHQGPSLQHWRQGLPTVCVRPLAGNER